MSSENQPLDTNCQFTCSPIQLHWANTSDNGMCV